METTRMMGMEYRRRWGPYVERLVSEYTALDLIYRGDGGWCGAEISASGSSFKWLLMAKGVEQADSQAQDMDIDCNYSRCS